MYHHYIPDKSPTFKPSDHFFSGLLYHHPPVAPALGSMEARLPAPSTSVTWEVKWGLNQQKCLLQPSKHFQPSKFGLTFNHPLSVGLPDKDGVATNKHDDENGWCKSKIGLQIVCYIDFIGGSICLTPILLLGMANLRVKPVFIVAPSHFTVKWLNCLASWFMRFYPSLVGSIWFDIRLYIPRSLLIQK